MSVLSLVGGNPIVALLAFTVAFSGNNKGKNSQPTKDTSSKSIIPEKATTPSGPETKKATEKEEDDDDDDDDDDD